MRTIALLALVLITGCSSPSLKPLYTDDVVIHDDALVGTWSDGDNVRFSVAKGTAAAYSVVCQDIGDDTKKPVELDVVLVEIGGHRYIDIAPSDKARQEVGERYGALFLPAHTFARVTLDGNTISIEQIDMDWLTMHAPNLGVATVEVEKTGVLTAEPRDLQQMMIQLQDQPEAFTDPYVLTREQG